MTDKGSGWPLPRPASRAGRVALLVPVLVIGIPVWLAIVAALTLFALLRPLLTLLTGVVFTGGLAVAIYFAFAGPEAAAIRAAFIAVLSGAFLFAVTALAERLGLEGRPAYPVPPWWWFV